MKKPEINPDLTEIVSELKEKEDNDKSDLFLKEARSSIEIASQLINSIMSGRQIDVAFFKHLAADRHSRAEMLKKYAVNYKKKRK